MYPEELHAIELAMVLAILFIAGSAAALVGAVIERFVIRPIGKRRGWCGGGIDANP